MQSRNIHVTLRHICISSTMSRNDNSCTDRSSLTRTTLQSMCNMYKLTYSVETFQAQVQCMSTGEGSHAV